MDRKLAINALEKVTEALEAAQAATDELTESLRIPEEGYITRLQALEAFRIHVTALPLWLAASIKFWETEPHIFPPSKEPPRIEEFVDWEGKESELREWYEFHSENEEDSPHHIFHVIKHGLVPKGYRYSDDFDDHALMARMWDGSYLFPEDVGAPEGFTDDDEPAQEQA